VKSPPDPAVGRRRRADLHCHSDASNQVAEAALKAIACPECYSAPADVYAQAKRRGMDFVTITDHDSIAGVARIADRADVLVGEELTCWFPEDDCKMHVLVFGISPEDHDQLQRRANNIYDVADYVAQHRIAHSVAHPIYRQNDKLERWHLERLILMFKGFECLNGAHSPLHREAFEPVLDRLTRQEMHKLAERHGLEPKWPEPWVKARTGGSDDHGLLNIGRTWTELPAEARTVGDVLDCLRSGACRPGGEEGSSAKLAHTFYSVAVRYYARQVMKPGMSANLPARILQTIVGERPAPGKAELAKLALKRRVTQIGGNVLRPVSAIAEWCTRGNAKPAKEVAAPPARASDLPQDGHVGTGILKQLFLASARNRLGDYPALCEAMGKGLPPLGEHAAMFDFACALNRDVSRGLAEAISDSIDDASFTGLFDAIAAVLAQQFVLAPYYFAVFHQNKERHLLRQITNQPRPADADGLKVALFTDTLDEVNGVARFVRDLAGQAHRFGRGLTVHTCAPEPKFDLPNRKNFAPLFSKPLPLYPQLKLNFPPVLEVLHWADRQQFDAVHISTPGPMGMVGWAVAKMLRVPVLGTYHTDFPAYLHHLTRDHRFTDGCTAYMRWLYGQMAGVFSRSRSYCFNLRDLGVAEDRLHQLPPAVDLGTFHPGRRDVNLWAELRVAEPIRLLYCGRVSVEKNLPMLVRVFASLCELRRRAGKPPVALVVAGDGPYLAQMKRDLAGRPAYFLGFQGDDRLGALYAGADLFVFPSCTDTLGQAVMEAQACGLPAVVTNVGGPKETVADDATGLVLPAGDAERWCRAIDALLDDEPRRQRMSRAAPARMSWLSFQKTFKAFWDQHIRAAHQHLSTAVGEFPASMARTPTTEAST
jgi:glycosyltransferase involved in cell wall biosynthesis